MIVRPFKALRPTKDMVSKIAAKPYDVVTEEQAREVAKNNPYTFYKVSRPEINFEHSADTHDPKVLETGRKHLEWLKEQGFMFVEDKPAFYIYQQQWRDHVQTGIFATFSVDEYIENKIKKHELTRKDKEDERALHVKVVKAHTGPVFLMYKSQPEIDHLIMKHATGEPEYDYTDESGVRHIVWVLKDENEINKIAEAFKNVEAFYIADGHHRAAAAVRAAIDFRNENPNYTGEEEFNYFLAALFPHNQLKILDYNRVVKDLNGNSEEEFIKKVSEKFDVTPIDGVYKPESKHTIGMYLNKKWYKLVPKTGTYDENDVIASLDVSILQNNLLAPILGIENPRTDKRIDFVGGILGIEELIRLVDSGSFKVAFAMYPTSIDDLLKVSDEGKIMPPKSTWFEPKLKSGIVVHLI
ncbi:MULTISPECIES: DUF1015 domain-containing protein [Fervidobacterium]|uniref:DUF1015 domain-containing protein n=1 Tax=Fervidobacterium nodosum (strain ATCC 35602 / DSM 5306 / Rt17-B1) TaxID=381764 RepID=A7HJ70_FERNB|nr:MULTISPECIES: DUF1015 family protein [Fervidobacterium]ABS59953.1 conserved hypothetical protein [Fervidobacterium nodosum Rt17-B1]KAF2961681.1 hypothetical protein AS161_08370 [Fervidobacterium sp. 2310opik-2]PHJ13259.1 hypothetical protein IM41_06240 [Fervidobacterium sp. SC_NGM5_G05]